MDVHSCASRVIATASVQLTAWKQLLGHKTQVFRVFVGPPRLDLLRLPLAKPHVVDALDAEGWLQETAVSRLSH